MTRLPALLALLALAACGGAGQRLEGAWELDWATFDLVPRFRDLPPAERADVLARHRFDVTFADGRVTWDQQMQGWGAESKQGRYRVAATEGNRATLELEWDDGRSQRFTVTVDEKNLRFSLGGRSVILRRKRP